MINIILSNITYEYDVYTLVKAFYPEETIKVYEKEGYLQTVGSDSDTKAIDSQTKVCDDQISFSQGEANHTQAEVDGSITDEVSGSRKPLGVLDIMLREVSVEFLEACIQVTFVDINFKSQTQTLTIEAATPKSQYKNAMKRMLYGMLYEATNRTLPWGILTGIRPTKLVYELLEQGDQDAEIRHKMKEVYLCSDAKLSMSLRIAKREEELLKEMDYRNGYSLYIGIPFCPSTCLYCSFTSYSIAKYSNYVEAYLAALKKEIEFAATCFPNKKLTTVYFGGGTPTTLTAEQLDYLLGLVKKSFDFTYVKEFCVEAGRPDSITKEKLQVLKKWGVDRISINPQSMQQKTLDLIGRKHSVEEIKEAFQLARETGHDNINMDIIIGLPGENPEDVTDTLKQINELNPDSITVHTLALKRAARLNIEKENYINMKASEVPAMLEQTIEFADRNDYLPYYLYRQKNMADNLENIGYARFGKEGLYNILIMEEQQTILALGAGGMSKFVFYEENRIERVDNVKSVTDYIDRIDEMIKRKQQFLIQNETL